MADITPFQEHRDKYLALYDRGLLTDSEAAIAFVTLLTEVPDDGIALALCAELPQQFQAALRDSLDNLAATNYDYRPLGIGDSRTDDEAHRDAIRRREVLRRLAPRIRTLLKQAPA